MKRSKTVTNYVLIKAETNSEWDCCGFAIINLSDTWRNAMQRRLIKIELFQQDDSFSHHAYWDVSVNFYQDGINVEGLLSNEENWVFVTVKKKELERLTTPENKLDAHQLILTKYGGAYFKAYGKHTGEEFWTENFDPEQLINKTVAK